MDDLLKVLNEEQIKPVTDTEGAVLVLAGAGSGKTRVLTTRIAYILQQRLAQPWQILAITFTNKAAGEMRERVQKNVADSSSMWICTIHSMCVRILRANIQAAGIKPDFSIYSETERKNVIKKCLKELDIDDDKAVKTAQYHIGNAKMLGLDADQYVKKHAFENHIDEYMRVYEAYEKRLKENNALDFDDLLLCTLRLLRSNKEVREYYADRFKYILVDEFQDTNYVQYSIIKLLVKEGGNLFCVGDDDQSIYGWRGAEIDNILRFDSDYPKARIYKLERNYRSTENILNLANEIIKNNGKRRGKKLWTDHKSGDKPTYFCAEDELGEALYAARIISQMVNSCGYRYSDFAVLMRVNALTRSFEQEFNKYNIPYKVFGGLKFFERREIKDILAYMRLTLNPYDNEAFNRIINVPRRGIGNKTLEIMENYAAENGLSLYDAVFDSAYLPLTPLAKGRLDGFGALVKDLVIQSQTMPVNDFVRYLIQHAGLREAQVDDNDLANIDEFVASVDDYCRLNPEATLYDYLSSVTLYSDTDEMDESDYVTLATVHAVKGLEFRAVFIVGLEEGIMPSSRAEEKADGMEEERRLMYVAITRARENLYLTRARERNLYGRRSHTAMSRFVKELAAPLGVKDAERAANANSANGYTYKRYGADYGNGGGHGGYSNGGYANGGGYGKTAYFGSYDNDGSFGAGGNGFGNNAGAYSSPSKSFNTGNNKMPQQGKYRVGTKVYHAKFGNGTVISMRNNGAVINVAFDGQGIKELSATIAPLKILQY